MIPIDANVNFIEIVQFDILFFLSFEVTGINNMRHKQLVLTWLLP